MARGGREGGRGEGGAWAAESLVRGGDPQPRALPKSAAVEMARTRIESKRPWPCSQSRTCTRLRRTAFSISACAGTSHSADRSRKYCSTGTSPAAAAASATSSACESCTLAVVCTPPSRTPCSIAQKKHSACPSSTAATATVESHGQAFLRAHWSTCKWPCAAASMQVRSSHGARRWRAHRSTSIDPAAAAAAHVSSSHGQRSFGGSERANCSTASCPSRAAASMVVSSQLYPRLRASRSTARLPARAAALHTAGERLRVRRSPPMLRAQRKRLSECTCAAGSVAASPKRRERTWPSAASSSSCLFSSAVRPAPPSKTASRRVRHEQAAHMASPGERSSAMVRMSPDP